MDSSSLVHARLEASIEGTDGGAEFWHKSHELDRETETLVPPAAIGRMLSPDQVAKIIRRIERGIPERPAAASAKRMGKRRPSISQPSALMVGGHFY